MGRKPKMRSSTLNVLKAIDIVQFNQDAEAAFVSLVTALLEEAGEGGLTQTDIVREAAFEIGISPVTARRYLFKYTARRAPFVADGKRVRLRFPRQ